MKRANLSSRRLHAHEAPLLRLKIGDRMIRRRNIVEGTLQTQQFDFAGRSGDTIHLCDTQYAGRQVYAALCAQLRQAHVCDLDTMAHDVQFINYRHDKALHLLAAVDYPSVLSMRIESVLGRIGVGHVFVQALARSLSTFNQGEAHTHAVVSTGYTFAIHIVDRASPAIYRTSLGKSAFHSRRVIECIMDRTADRMQVIPFSGVRAMYERATELERQGSEVIHLELGRPDFVTPQHIRVACSQALENGHVHYTSNYGIPQLREAIAGKLAHDNGLCVDPEREVIVTVGVSEGIVLAMMALLNPSDEVLIPEPIFPPYVIAAHMAGAVPVAVPVSAANDYKPSLLDLHARVGPRTRMLVLTTPGNPTGGVLSRQDLADLAAFAIDRDLLVLADEVYEKLVYDDCRHVSIASLPGMRSRTITLNGFSKTYAMTGWRLGYVVAVPEIIHALVRVHQYSVVCANAFSQWGAVAALEGPQHQLEAMVEELDCRRRFVIGRSHSYLRDCLSAPSGGLICVSRRVFIRVECVSVCSGSPRACRCCYYSLG